MPSPPSIAHGLLLGAPQLKTVGATTTERLEPHNPIVTNFYTSHSGSVLFKVKLYFVP